MIHPKKKVKCVNLTGLDVAIDLDTAILDSLGKQIKSAVAENSTQIANSCKVQLVFRDQANFNNQNSKFNVRKTGGGAKQKTKMF